MAITRTPRNAGIFATKKIPPIKPLLATLVPDARVSESRNADMTLFLCEWQDVTVQLTIDPHWDRPIQCAGMKGWISRHAVGHQNQALVEPLIRKIDSTVDCVGSVISPGYDSSGKAASLVLALATAFDGYIFSHQSFYDAHGVKVIGDDSDPMSLKETSQRAHDFQVSDLIGEWRGRAPDGSTCRYIFFANGSCTNLVESDSFKHTFGPEGLKAKYAIRENSPFWEFDTYDFEHGRMKGMLFQGIFQPIGKDAFKLEGIPKHFGPRPSDFSHEVITFKRVTPGAAGR